MLPAHDRARDFQKNEKQFRLGALLTERGNPKTAHFSETIKQHTIRGVDMLLAVDGDIVDAAPKVFNSQPFAKLVRSMTAALTARRRICFSGCGATGRLSILLESCWRGFVREFHGRHPQLARKAMLDAGQAISIMTGGDYALVKSVENFEDFTEFGREQVRESGLGPGDLLVAISEGGETSSVIGTVLQSVASGSATCFVFNNPAKVLAEKIERSRRVLKNRRVNILELVSGPMAIAGSTRMQATTFELLVCAAALEIALCETLASRLSRAEMRAAGLVRRTPGAYADLFARLLDEIRGKKALAAIAQMIEFEERIYRAHGLVTYFSDDFILDVFTDTAERSPTFMLPSFKSHADHQAPEPWAFVKNPVVPTKAAWRRMLLREPRCLKWDAAVYQRLGAPARLGNNPPRLALQELCKIRVGNENSPARHAPLRNAAVLIMAGDAGVAMDNSARHLLEAFQRLAVPFKRKAALVLGNSPGISRVDALFNVPCKFARSPLQLWRHLAVKLVLNTMSTGTMGRMGRIEGNLMTHVHPTNKKLVDRGIRLVANLTGMDYGKACQALFRAMDTIRKMPPDRQNPVSPVILAVENARKSSRTLKPPARRQVF